MNPDERAREREAIERERAALKQEREWMWRGFTRSGIAPFRWRRAAAGISPGRGRRRWVYRGSRRWT